MKYIAINCVLVLLFFISTINRIQCTCVLDSDFGFSLNCAFKKSGLFRVRNLGGVKGHFGFGFSVGDDLGFPESLGNLEGNKRRSLNLQTGANSIGVLPASKMPAPSSAPVIQSRPQALTVRNMQQVVAQLGGRPVSSPYMQYQKTKVMSPYLKNGVRQQLATRPPPYHKPPSPAMAQMTQAAPLPLGVPAFKPIPPPDPSLNVIEILKMTTLPPSQLKFVGLAHQVPFENTTRLTRMPQLIDDRQYTQNIPPFQIMPDSVSRISSEPVIQLENVVDGKPKNFVQDPNLPQVDLKGHTIEELAIAANVTTETIEAAIKMRQQQLYKEQKSQTIKAQQQYLLEQQRQHEILLQQQQVKEQQDVQLNFEDSLRTERVTAPTSLVSTERPYTTTPKKIIPTRKAIVRKAGEPKKQYSVGGNHKVMNAPKEYYPVGYDKNFDDNFTSKVDLPPTSFHCGDQKYFPGLYGDEDLGCMVFHVCALTDDGLIMKSFLCPESTLFDQTVLKCNWWFYVDCKSSKSLYDSNLPVSKSYQLMKALSYFSNYKKNNDTALPVNPEMGLDVEALKNSVSDDRS